MKTMSQFVACSCLALALGAATATAQSPADFKRAADEIEAETASVKKARETMEKNSETFRFGLSLGWRHIKSDTESLLQDVALDPVTGHVVPERIDRGAVVLSGVLTAFPWRNAELQSGTPKTCSADDGPSCRIRSASSLWRLGFIANVNVASFTQDNIAEFNKSIEGGLGVAYKMNEDFALALTAERVFGRSLRAFVRTDQPLVDGEGQRVTELVSTDDRYFRDNNLGAWSVKFVYFFK